MTISYQTDGVEQFLKEMIPFTPGIIRQIAQDELMRTCREFYQRSMAWKTTLEQQVIPVGDNLVTFDVGANNEDYAEVLAVDNLWWGNDDEGYRPLNALSGRPEWWSQTNPEAEGWYVSDDATDVKLYPLVEGDPTPNVLRATVFLTMTEDSSPFEPALPRMLFDRWYETVKAGYLGRVYEHPSKPYSQPLMAERYRRKFLKDCGYYAAQRKKGLNNTPVWRFPMGWSPSRRFTRG